MNKGLAILILYDISHVKDVDRTENDTIKFYLKKSSSKVYFTLVK